MPFRVPNDYHKQTLIGGISNRDPQPLEVHEYIAWLKREIAIAEAYLGSLACKSPPVPEPRPKVDGCDLNDD